MKIGRNTQQRIAAIKAEVSESRRQLETQLIRLQEHSGTKRIASKLKMVIDKLEDWQKVA